MNKQMTPAEIELARQSFVKLAFGVESGAFWGFARYICMDRERLIEHLAQAERHVAEGEVHVEKQREQVEKLARRGHDTSKFVARLKQFEELLTMHILDRDRLREELAETYKQTV